jgi:hypothetical protein
MLGLFVYFILTLVVWVALVWQVSLSEAEGGHRQDH